jgi:hypothetical protein
MMFKDRSEFMNRLTGFCLLVMALTSSSLAVDYAQLMTKKVKAVLGNNATKGYTFSTYPIDNFGLATAYESKVDLSTQVCATWDCLGVSSDELVEKLSAEHKMRLVVDDVQYAEVGAGGNVNLSDEEKKSLGFKALLPQLFSAVGVSFDLNTAKTVTVDLSTGPVTIRTLRRKQMLDRISSAQGHSLEKSAFEKGNLVLVYSDIVITSMKIDLKVDAQSDVGLDAKLNGALGGQVGKVVGSNASLNFKINKADKGDYSFEVTKPLILAVAAKKQPSAGHLGGETGWNAWKDTDLGSNNKIVQQSLDLGDLPQ